MAAVLALSLLAGIAAPGPSPRDAEPAATGNLPPPVSVVSLGAARGARRADLGAYGGPGSAVLLP
jgi:hypothetical protein